MENTETNEDFTICVVIPACNIADYIARAIDSVLTQTRTPDQIIVVDDGSTDNTAEIIKGYGDKLTYIHQENAGPAAARNTGIRNTDCDWIAFLDGDDQWLGGNLKLHCEVISNNPDIVWSAGNCISCLCGENRKAPTVNPDKAKKALAGKNYFEDFFTSFTLDIRGNSNTTIIKHSAIEQVGPFQHGLPYSEDIEMWFRMAMSFPKIGFIPEPIAIYHLNRPGTLSEKTTSEDKISTMCNFVRQSIELSKKQNCFDRFNPCVRYYLKRHIRGWLFQKDLATTIRGVISQFDDVLGGPYITLVKTLTVCPGLTSMILHGISKIVRILNLRKTVVKRPQKSD
ncbi:MAG: glycosyltransferase [Planctomycetes bacterium]|nr:glycosyltransferase [Planctomycetota bacterium]